MQAESVHILQQLILWSSPFVNLATCFPILQAGLTSDDTALRKASIRCLRQWGEKDLTIMIRKNLERRLIDMVCVRLAASSC